MKFVWHEVTRNHHVASVGDIDHVASVLRPQKNQSDGTKHDWQVEVLGSRWRTGDTFTSQCDVRDLDSMKSSAEARARFYILRLAEQVRRCEVSRTRTEAHHSPWDDLAACSSSAIDAVMGSPVGYTDAARKSERVSLNRNGSTVVDFIDHESVPPLPWVDVASRIRKLRPMSASSAAFARAIASVAHDIGYELRKIPKGGAK